MSNKLKAVILTRPVSKDFLKKLDALGLNAVNFEKYNTATVDEIKSIISDAHILIAGTLKMNETLLSGAPEMKLICRFGIGLDNVDFEYCKKQNIKVVYTPDAPTQAVAELIVGFMLDLTRKFSSVNMELKSNKWHRYVGSQLSGKTIGIIGMGRIGKSLIRILSAFNMRFLVSEIEPDKAFANMFKVELTDKETVFRKADFLSVNIPLNEMNRGFITEKDISLMKNKALFINTSRGGIVNEEDLFYSLKNGMIAGAAVDVFEKEPYFGDLKTLDNCILTAHIGSCSLESRMEMERLSLENIVNFKNGKPLINEVFNNE